MYICLMIIDAYFIALVVLSFVKSQSNLLGENYRNSTSAYFVNGNT